MPVVCSEGESVLTKVIGVCAIVLVAPCANKGNATNSRTAERIADNFFIAKPSCQFLRTITGGNHGFLYNASKVGLGKGSERGSRCPIRASHILT